MVEPEVPWCVHTTKNNKQRFVCKRCNETHGFSLPISLDEYARQAFAFVELHRNCKERKR